VVLGVGRGEWGGLSLADRYASFSGNCELVKERYKGKYDAQNFPRELLLELFLFFLVDGLHFIHVFPAFHLLMYRASTDFERMKPLKMEFSSMSLTLVVNVLPLGNGSDTGVFSGRLVDPTK
jgi:hypothetical protein